MPLVVWTREKAVEAAAKSVASRKAKAERLRLERENPALTVLTTPPSSVQPQLERQLPADAYTAQRLTRIRKQLDRIDRLIESEDDPQRLDRLASASAKLSELARVLADVPLPGSRRPSSPRRSAQGAGGVVLE